MMETMTNSPTKKRLFFGNLPQKTTVNELQKLLDNYSVSNVEIKRKTALNQESVFAYVDLPETHVHQCLREYQSKKWNGCVLKVEVAKESFLDKLKKERSQRNENPGTTTRNSNVNDFGKFNNCAAKNKKIVFNSDDDEDVGHNNNSRISHHSDYNVNGQPIKRKLSKAITEETTDLSNDSEDELPRKRKLPMFRGVPAYETAVKKSEPDDSMKNFENFSDVWKDEDPKGANTKHSTLIKWKNLPIVEKNDEVSFNENKIVKQSKFSAESKRKNALEERWNSIKEKKAVIRKAIKTYDTKNKRIRFSDTANDEDVQINEKSKKIALFDENSSDDDFKVNFEVREELEGKSGMKLLKLKSKLSNDERFKIDKRFLDDNTTEAVNESIKGSTSKSDRLNNFLQNRSMIRYDPTKPEHKVLEKKIISKSPKEKKNKVKKKPAKRKPGNEETAKIEVEKPQVSKEKHYSVADTLKDAFKKDDSKSEFRLSSLFDEKLKKPISTDCDTKESSPMKKMKRVSNPFENLSESDDDIDDPSIDEAPVEVPLTVAPEKVSGEFGVWGETFFFKENDSRLEEAVNFYNVSNIPRDNDFANRRNKLRTIIRKKMQTSKREQREFKQKLGGINQKRFKMRLKKARF